MKCPKCDGTGKVNGLYFDTTKSCKYCNGTGEIEVTNEEYIRQCSTEELAIFLCNELQDDEVGTLANRFDMALYSEYPIRPMNAYHEIMRWLKDKHEPLKNDEK